MRKTAEGMGKHSTHASRDRGACLPAPGRLTPPAVPDPAKSSGEAETWAEWEALGNAPLAQASAPGELVQTPHLTTSHL